MLDTNLINQGVTAEDLEKAASVRLFEKAAAAQGIDLNQFSTEDVEELYNNFVNGEEKMDAVEIFEKVAEAEGIELDTLEDEQLAGLFNHFVEEVLPEMIAAEEGGEEVGEDEEIEEAHAKLAEAEILGRHMARSFIDEQEKLAGLFGKKEEAQAAAPGRVRRMLSAIDDKAVGLGKSMAGVGSGGKGRGGLKTHRALGYGVPGAAAAGLAYGGKKMYDKRKKSSMKTASILEKLAAEAEAQPNALVRAGRAIDDKAVDLGKYLAGIGSGGAGRGGLKTHRALGYGVPTLAAGGLAYGGKKLYDRKKSEKTASFEEIEELAQERAFEALIEARAEEILSELE